MDSLRLIALLVFTFGLFAYGAMLTLWVRQFTPARTGTHPAPGDCRSGNRSVERLQGALAVVAFFWFGTNLWATLLQPLPPGSWPAPLGLAATITVFLFPPLIMHVVYAERRAQAGPNLRGRFWGGCVVLMYAASQFVSLVIILAWAQLIAVPSLMLQLTGLWIGVLFLLTGVYCAALLATKRPLSETPRDRQSRQWMVGMFAILILLFLPMVLAHTGHFPFVGVLDLFAKSLPLMFLFVGTYFDNRYEFFDVFIKRGFFLIVVIVLLTAYLGFVLPWLDGLRQDWARPWVYAVALLPLVAALPALYGRLAGWLDRMWLGRQFTSVEAVKHFLTGSKEATSESQLIEAAERELAAVFQAPTRIHLSPTPTVPEGFERVLELPVVSGGERIGVIVLGPRTTHVPFFSEDVTLLGSLADVFASMLENVRLQQKRQEQERLARELSLHASRSELKALRAQINPHFLFNALNAIAGLIHKDPGRADDTVEQLAEVFRYTLRRSENEWAQLGDELEFVTAYLAVEQARFGARLQFDIQADDSIGRLKVPTMMIQTLVENAVKHGIAGVRGPARIEIRAARQGDRLRIEVADSGPGFDARRQAGPPRPSSENSGYGLRNIRERLHGYYGDGAWMEIGGNEVRQMTTVALILPVGAGAETAKVDAPAPETPERVLR
jgi:signal transduction histidine kinase